MIELRPYQEKALECFSSRLIESSRSLIVLPTGSGKTVIFCMAAKRHNLKTLVISHTVEIQQQTLKAADMVGYKDIHSETVQWAARPQSIERLKKEKFDLLIIDECHRSVADTYMRLINSLGCKFVLGVTATPFRTDGKKIEEVFGDPIFSLTLIDLIEEGFLCDFEGYEVKTSISLNGISKTPSTGDFSSGRLSAVVNVSNRNELIVKEYKRLSHNEKSLCFCADLKHAESLKQEFLNAGITCETVFGKLEKNERSAILRRFKRGETRVLTNYQVLTEGFDEPSITCLIMARPTISKGLYMQMIGRGSRIYPGKEVCKVIEFTDNDFDVCQLQSLIDSRPAIFKRKHDGERFTSLVKRAKEELSLYGVETITNPKEFIRKTVIEKPASTFLLALLDKRGIKYKLPISEWEVSNLLKS